MIFTKTFEVSCTMTFIKVSEAPKAPNSKYYQNILGTGSIPSSFLSS